MEDKDLNLREILVLNAYWFGLSFMWNSLHGIILPAVMLFMVPEAQKNTYLGILTFFGLLIAMVVQPLSGAISDRWTSPMGQRRPLILAGTLIDFIFLAFLGWAGGLGWVAIGYIGLQFSSNIAHGPMQGLMPDIVPRRQFGWASGFKNLMDMSGLIIASLVMGRLLTPETRHPVGALSLVAVLLAAGAVTTLTGVTEKPALPTKPKPNRVSLREVFQIDMHLHANYAWMIASRLFYLVGIYGIQAFAQYYVRDVLVVPNPIQLTGDLLASLSLALVVFAVVGGKLGDRFGHWRMCQVASGISAMGCLSLVWARTPVLLLVFGSILGVGIGMFITSNWALANQLAPADQAGKFLGLTNLATAGAAALGRLTGPFIDVLNNAWPGAWWGYTGLFVLGAVFIGVNALIMLRVSYGFVRVGVNP
jgi:MFS family permease